MDNRLDFICSFEDGTIEKMSAMRQKFMELDNELLSLIDPSISPNMSICPALNRSVALARTHLESSLMYAIKCLCLKYEVKHNHEKKDDVICQLSK